MAQMDSGSHGGSGMRATVKWFNATKGFGFVTLEDGTDAFCHASALNHIAQPDLPQGTTVFCDVANGQRGMQVTSVHSVDMSTADPAAPRGPRPMRGPGGGGAPRDSAPSGPMMDGQVKFFNEQKGFGFVVPDAGGPDIYLHASALRRSGIPNLNPEQKIRFSTRQGMKGVEVERVELA